MARPPRQVVPDQPLHIIQRGNNRTMCFMDEQDFRFYLDVLHGASQRAHCAVHAYVLMGNHAHMLVTPRDAEGPARMMQALGRRFVRYFNHVHQRTGTLWEGRYRSCLIDSPHYFFACSRYIELNPVRAGMIEEPGRYRWTSFRHNAFGNADKLVTPHPMYLGLGRHMVGRQAAYRALFERELEPAALDAIRHATNGGRALRSTGGS
ncbi:MAG: transposase [Gemmatimonadaceae bacterium]|nr:transposase [Gemmatimonadaceae bacterium]